MKTSDAMKRYLESDTCKKIMAETEKRIIREPPITKERRKDDNEFLKGVVVALDVVSIYDYGVCFKEIVESTGKEEVLKEIRKNGLSRTKEMAKSEFKDA